MPRSGLALAAAALIAVAGRAGAQSAAQVGMVFAAADTDHDGHLTRDEAKTAMPIVFRHFGAIDRGHKGYVTLADILAAMKAHPGAAARARPAGAP